MSIEAMEAVLNREDVPGTRKLVLLGLANHADANGVCWPSVPTLAKYASTTPRNVRRCLRWLEGWRGKPDDTHRLHSGLALIQAEQRPGRVTHYRLILDAPRLNAGGPATPDDLSLDDLSTPDTQGTPDNMSARTPRAPTPDTGDTPPRTPRAPTPDAQRPLTVRTVIEPSRTVKARARAIPDDFTPRGADLLKIAIELRVSEDQLMTQLPSFKDHWRSTGETKANWNATWRNGMRLMKKWGRFEVDGNGGRKPTQYEKQKAGFQERMKGYQREQEGQGHEPGGNVVQIGNGNRDSTSVPGGPPLPAPRR